MGNQEGFLSRQEEKHTPSLVMITMIIRLDKIIWGARDQLQKPASVLTQGLHSRDTRLSQEQWKQD